jgi:hypothetical protein
MCYCANLCGCRLFWNFIANKATTATQLGTIARISNTKDRVCVVLSDSFVLVALRDVACAIVPICVAVGFFGISLPLKL